MHPKEPRTKEKAENLKEGIASKWEMQFFRSDKAEKPRKEK